MKIPNPNTMQGIILAHMSRDIWIDIKLLYALLSIKYATPSFRNFVDSFYILKNKGFFESRKQEVCNSFDKTGSNWRSRLQYRLSEEAKLAMPNTKKVFSTSTKTASNCNWFLPANRRSRSVI